MNATQSGMTLIQMAGILLIISIMMVPFFQIQSLSKKNEILTESRGQVADVSQALVQFALTNGRYPLPANPAYSLTNSDAGTEATFMWADEATRDIGVKTGPSNTCHVVATPGDLRRCVHGNILTNDPTAPFGVNAAENRIVIGTVPFTALGLTPAQSLDEFGNKMTYAVTYGLTKEATFSNDKGNILVNDQGGGCPIVFDGGNPASKTHFVVVSHGQNRAGAFPPNGGARPVCGGTGNTVLSSEEQVNCDDNATFRMMSKRAAGVACTQNTAAPVTDQFLPGRNETGAFDDIVAFRTTVNSGNWTAQRTVDADGVSKIYQTFVGYRNSSENVVIGTNTNTGETALNPNTNMKKLATGQVQIECSGPGCVDKNNVQADRIETQFLCSIKDKDNNTVRSDYYSDACLRVKFFTARNTYFGAGKPVQSMVVSNIDPVTLPGSTTVVQYDIRSGYTGNDRGMLKVNRRETHEAQSPGIPTTSGANLCGDNGASGIDPNGRLICN